MRLPPSPVVRTHPAGSTLFRCAIIRQARRIMMTAGARALLASALWSVAPRLFAADAPARLTEPAQVWALSTAEKSTSHPLTFTGRVAYVDSRWRHLWLERDGLCSYVMLSTNPPDLRQGQWVRIEGSIVPIEGLDRRTVQVTVEPDGGVLVPVSIEGRIDNFAALHNRVITGSAFVDGQQLIDDDHLRLSLIMEDQPVTAYVKPANPAMLPQWAGGFITITALYQGRFDPTGTQATIELWTGRQEDVTLSGSLADSKEFDLPIQPIDTLPAAARGSRMRIRGRVMSSEPGRSLIVRDKTGQVVVETLQQQRVAAGTEIDAIGRVAMANAQWRLRSALFRPSARTEAPPPIPTGARAVLETVEEIRALGVEEAALARPISITGVVTWSMPTLDFFYVEDLTGGVRVRFHPEQMPPPPRNKYLHIRGVTYNGGFAPAIELTDYRDLGAMSSPPVKTITFEQAVTGQEDGQLVDIRGFYRTTESVGELRRIHVTTPSGEFIGLLKSPVDFVANPGSLLRVHGPCEVVADENGRVTSVIIRVPSLAALVVEEDAPANPYDLPRRSIKHLRQLNTSGDLTRVRVTGVVLHAVPGRMVYIQEDNSGLLLLSHQAPALSPGDRIEAVGILGWEGVRTVVREAMCRKTGNGIAPAPVPLTDPARLSLGLDSRLVRIRGTLIDAVKPAGLTRYTVQSGNTLFEATLDLPDGVAPPDGTDIGAGLDLTGVYRIEFDDSRKLRSFQLQLRSPADVRVYQRPELWTLRRALIAAGVLGGVTLLAFAWVTALRRRVRRQTAQIRAQLERQAQLEAEVQHATRLEALGVLAGGIAHDFNNLLTIIMGNLGLAMLDERAMKAVGDCLRDSHRGATRARDLTQQLLTFSKGGDPLRTTVALPDVVRETAEFVLRGSNARCEYDIPGGLWSANVDRAQVAQVIQNLVINANQAMPNGGIIRIALRNDDVDGGGGLAAGRYLRLTIADSGQGIPPDILPRIFDPYFSTKKTGSGLGLATVYSIVRKHQGHVQVESRIGAGTVFTLWLPAADPAALASAEAAAGMIEPVLPNGRSGRVLLMDDEEPIRRLGANLLRRMNLPATLVADGDEAVRAFAAARQAGQPFDLVILDLTIPGAMGGREAIVRIRQLDSAVPAIVSSGYSNDSIRADHQRWGFQAIVTKPYDVNELGATVRQLLAGREAHETV